MDGVLRPDFGNFFSVALVAIVAVWLFNRALRAAGMPGWTTAGA